MVVNLMKRDRNPIRFAILVGIIATILSTGAAAFAQDLRFVVVDVEKVIRGYDRYEADMIAMKEDFRPQVDALTAEQEAWTKRRTAALEAKPPLDPVAAEEVRSNLAAEYEKMEGRKTLIAESVRRAELDIREALLKDLDAEIARLVNEENLTIVFRTDRDSVLYLDETLDITNKIIDRLNAAYKKKK